MKPPHPNQNSLAFGWVEIACPASGKTGTHQNQKSAFTEPQQKSAVLRVMTGELRRYEEFNSSGVYDRCHCF